MSGPGATALWGPRGGLLAAAWRWVQARRATQTRAGRLRVAESVSLGEKRFVAVLEFDGRQFLVGGGGSGVCLLAALEPVRPFADVLRQSDAAL